MWPSWDDEWTQWKAPDRAVRLQSGLDIEAGNLFWIIWLDLWNADNAQFTLQPTINVVIISVVKMNNDSSTACGLCRV